MYATQDDIVTLYTEDALVVADRDGDGVPDVAAIARALVSASGEIDTSLHVRYELPLTASHPILTQYCVDIALYRLAGSSSMMTEELRQRYEDALKGLDQIASGKKRLVIAASADGDEGSDSAASDDGSVAPIVTGGPERLFSRDKTRGL